jgi:hypothetical protein
MPKLKYEEAARGETALRLADKPSYSQLRHGISMDSRQHVQRYEN